MAKNKNTLHEKAMAIFATLRTTRTLDKARRTIRNYNLDRKEATFQLKPIFTAMQEKFEAGEKIEAATSMKEYCKIYKSSGCFTYARVRQILTGKSGNENKSKVKSLDRVVLTPGMLIEVDGVTYRIRTPEETHARHLSTTKPMTNPKFANVTLQSLEVMAAKSKAIVKTQPVKKSEEEKKAQLVRIEKARKKRIERAAEVRALQVAAAQPVPEVLPDCPVTSSELGEN
jgi:hypothetical protein